MDLFDFLFSRWYLSLPLFITLVSWWIYENNKGGKKIGPTEATQLVNQNAAFFLDIRDRDSFESGHIHGSINVPKESFKQQEHLLVNDKAVIVVSENGLDAGGAGVELKQLGVKEVFLLKHGLVSWAEESLPLVK